jgi:mannose-6-phosphate isomerase-like protein (cupin superfamily)
MRGRWRGDKAARPAVAFRHGDRSMDIVDRKDVKPYRTKDGSLVREIVHPDHIPVRHLSLAEALLEAGSSTALHYHTESEEVYYVIRGAGALMIAGEEAEIGPGQAILIPSHQRHRVVNTGNEDLVFLCISSPPYTHEDTQIEQDED